jgi:tyrosinase
MARPRLALLLPFICLTQTLVHAQYTAYDYGFDVKARVKRSQLDRRAALVVQDKAAAATAAAAGDVEVLVRQEIRQLEQDTDLWTLYILGLSMMQFTDQASPTSYYGLAGLWSCHSLRFVSLGDSLIDGFCLS